MEQQSEEFIRLQCAQLVGAKVTIYFPSFASQEVSAWTGTILDLPEWHGFMTAGGGWSLYSRLDSGDRPSYRVLVRKRRRKKLSYLRLDDAISVKMGW